MILKERYRKFLKLWMAKVELKKRVWEVELAPSFPHIDIFIEMVWVADLYKSGEYVIIDEIPGACEFLSADLRYFIKLLLKHGLKERIYEIKEKI
jgi:hypothetical protein